MQKLNSLYYNFKCILNVYSFYFVFLILFLVFLYLFIRYRIKYIEITLNIIFFNYKLFRKYFLLFSKSWNSCLFCLGRTRNVGGLVSREPANWLLPVQWKQRPSLWKRTAQLLRRRCSEWALETLHFFIVPFFCRSVRFCGAHRSPIDVKRKSSPSLSRTSRWRQLEESAKTKDSRKIEEQGATLCL